mmetsp:Transcript_5423/g.13831  ORF Transcript_5423/g.13831 Transcript_5423/m.13831 type:complete len:460 (-) Transcript_5423:125-1504(-)
MPPPRFAPLPRAGELIQHDYRPAAASEPVLDGNTSDGLDVPHRPVRLLQWNIERGYELEGIIAELKRVDADVLALQEIDIGCARSNWEDTGQRIARELQLNYAFVCEFEELYSSARDDRSQGGGVHGNAILTKYDMSEVETIRHRYEPVDWEDEGTILTASEPRRGGRVSLAARVHCPQGPLVVYCAHLEVFSGILGRLEQFSEILKSSKARLARGQQRQAILGDLNTMGHGIARMSPQHCGDGLRWRTLGMSEGQFWLEAVLAVQDPEWGHRGGGRAWGGDEAGWREGDRGSPGGEREGHSGGGGDGDGGDSATCVSLPVGCIRRPLKDSSSGWQSIPTAEAVGGSAQAAAAKLRDSKPGELVFVNGGCNKLVNERLLGLGLSAEVCSNLLNPGFVDPFDVTTTTLEPDFTKFCGYPLMNGKLDWLLLRALEVRHKEIGNHDYSLSDHKWLAAEVAFP